MDSLAKYVEKILIHKGYKAEVPEGTEALAKASDIFLVRPDGMTFAAICLIDSENGRKRRFQMTLEEMVTIAKELQTRYCGTINGSPMPVTLEVIEIRRDVSKADLDRLAALRKNFRQLISAVCVDLDTGLVTSNRWEPFGGRRRFLEKALSEPRLSEEALQPELDATLPAAARLGSRFRPWTSYSLIAALVLVFGLELKFGRGSLWAPDDGTLMGLGALNTPLILQGSEWWRMLSAAFLHADWLHLIFNIVALYMAGIVLEPLIGGARLLAIFFLSALGGSALSMGWHDTMLGIGASGAIMGLLAAAFAISFRLPALDGRVPAQTRLIQILLPSLLPLATTHGRGSIDYAAHIGGAAVGGSLGWVLFKTWPRNRLSPSFEKLGQITAFTGLAALVGISYIVVNNFHWRDLDPPLAKAEALPKWDDLNDLSVKVPILLRDYPADPRSHLAAGLLLKSRSDLAGAEQEYRKVVVDPIILALHFKPELGYWAHALLAECLLLEGRQNEAEMVAQVPCVKGNSEMVKELASKNLCK